MISAKKRRTLSLEIMENREMLSISAAPKLISAADVRLGSILRNSPVAIQSSNISVDTGGLSGQSVDISVSELGLNGVRRLTVADVNGEVQKWNDRTKSWQPIRPLTFEQTRSLKPAFFIRNTIGTNDTIRWIPKTTSSKTTTAFRVNYVNRGNRFTFPATIIVDMSQRTSSSEIVSLSQTPTTTSNLSSAGISDQPVPKGIWFPSGLDILHDPVTGRLAVPENLGSARISGSANSPVVWQDPVTQNAFLYVGASNGGVYLRQYTFATDRWSDRWTWVSMPGTGYSGSQSIGALAISPDGQYLAVGQGNASNYAAIAVPGSGIQIGKIQADGTLEWQENSQQAAADLEGLHIRSLKWVGDTIYATHWTGGFSNDSVGRTLIAGLAPAGGIGTVITGASYWNFVIDTVSGIPDSPVLIAGHVAPSTGNVNGLGFLEKNGDITPLQGVVTYLQGLAGQSIARISVYPELIDGSIIMFVGSFPATGSDMISRIDRLVVDPSTRTLISFTPAYVSGLVGSSQAKNDQFYGNFTLVAQPEDPTANSVLAGGNLYSSYNAVTFAGGLVNFDFSSGSPTAGPFIYGPVRDATGETGAIAPGQPHADSRNVTFFKTPQGLALIQTDDGGVWQFGPVINGFWQSLSTPGLNTLESLYSDWNAGTNSVAASYQDNAASLGNYGLTFSNNVSAGDGQFAFFDDGAYQSDQGVVSGYFAAQQYLVYDGRVNRVAINKFGQIISYDTIEMYYSDGDGYVQFGTPESVESADGNNTPFYSPIEPNAYRSGNIVMTGQYNLYETSMVDPSGTPDSLVFDPLMPFATPGVNKYLFNSLDNQGSSVGANANYDSLYAGIQILDTVKFKLTDTQVIGRQWNNESVQNLNPIYSANQEKSQLISQGLPVPEWLFSGGIVDIAHQSSSSRNDVIYWLQGGNSISTKNTTFNDSMEQVLRVQLSDGTLKTFDLASLGIHLDQTNRFKLQTLTYVPAVNGHTEYLVAGGQGDIWISELNAAGEPVHFTPMNWTGLPAGTAPGSYTTRMMYDPTDDLLIATQLGQGSWLYSFKGQIGSRPVSDQALNLSETVLQQQAEPSRDKRGNQINTNLVVQLNDQLVDLTKATDVYVEFENFALWQQNLDLLSPLFVVTGTPESLNLLTEAGQQRYGATLQPDGSLRLPLHFEPGVNTIMLQVNASEFPDFVPTFSLKFSATTSFQPNPVNGLLVLNSGTSVESVLMLDGRSSLDPYSPQFNPQDFQTPRFVYPEDSWVIGPVRRNLPPRRFRSNNIIYIGTLGNKAYGGNGNDLLYVDDNTTGVNKLFGGAGRNEFRLVSSYYDLPPNPQLVMDFKPGRDRIGLVGVKPEDVQVVGMRNGSRLFVYGQEVGRFLNVGPRRLQNLNNFIFYP